MTPDQIYCTSCGTANPAGARFCYKCGALIQVVEESAPPAALNAEAAQPEGPVVEPETMPEKKGSRALEWILIAVVLFVIIVVAGILSYPKISEKLAAMRATPTSTSTATATATITNTPTPTPIGLSEDLSAVIANASDGDTLYLEPGTYTLAQGIVIQKTLTIIGAGRDQTKIVTSKTSAYLENHALMHFDGEGTLSLKGISLVYEGSDPSSVLKVYNGHLELSDCRISGATLTTDKKIQFGLVLTNSSNGHVDNCVIDGNTNVGGDAVPGGIGVAKTAQLDLSNSQFLNSDFAIVTYDSAKITVTSSEISGTKYGIYIQGTSEATLTENVFTKNSIDSILYRGNSTGTASLNQITGNGDDLAIYVTEEAAPTLEKNTVDGSQVGIYYKKTGGGIARQNEISNSVVEGIAVKDTSAPTLEENTIKNQATDSGSPSDALGITYSESAGGTASKNTISGFVYGISVSGSATPLLEENTLTDNTGAIGYGAKAGGTARGNKISNNQYGIIVQNEASPTLEENEIFSNKYSIQLDKLANPTLKNNNIHDNTTNDIVY